MKKSILAGLLIAIAGYANLIVGGIPGACIFAFGLLSICALGLNLFTGKAGSCDFTIHYTENSPFYLFLDIFCINIFAVIFAGIILPYNQKAAETVAIIIQDRVTCPLYVAFIKAIFCGLIMEIAVYIYKNNKSYLGILFGVPLFILCGFYHCIADMFYMAYDASINKILYIECYGTWLISVIGNFVGCNIRRLCI